MPSATATELRFDVHGLSVLVRGAWPEVVAQVALDFAFFDTPGAGPGRHPDVIVEVHDRPPDTTRFGPARATFVTPRNVVFHVGGQTVIDYQGRAIAAYDREHAHIQIEGEDPHLVHEAAYQFLLSAIGEHLDACGLPRLHALALSGAQGAVAILLPSGGGKSTLALRALRDTSVRLLADDTPLVGPGGRLHPFTLRMGVNPGDAAAAPEGSTRLLERMEFHAKLAVEVGAFAHRMERVPQPLRHVVLGVRTLGGPAALHRRGRRAAVGPIVREAVVGVGVYQGMEFVLQRGMRDVVSHAGVAAMRARRCGVALARARVWELAMGPDVEANYHALRPLLT